MPFLLRLWLCLLLCLPLALPAQTWIAAPAAEDTPNLWQAFRHTFTVTAADKDNYVVQIAADSKYWLYVNGEMVVREGGLKRGPYRNAYYVDDVDLRPYIQPGENTIGILLWYFGKQGFSHQSSGFPGLWLDGPAAIRSSADWRAIVHPAFGRTGNPRPNYRLPESNISFDATKYDDDWKRGTYDASAWPHVQSRRQHPVRPKPLPFENSLNPRPRQNGAFYIDEVLTPVLPGHRGEYRPIPQWKDFGLQSYPTRFERSPLSAPDTVKMALPYNAQVTPYFRVDAPRAGMRIEILTDNYFGGGPPNVRTVYYTKKGVQSFETPGWMNGHEVWYVLPAGVEVLDLAYRESGYATEFTGTFTSSDTALNTLWTKAQRTLYLTMRDTYMDCPDRERAQWWGDVVNELGETFYALDRRSDALTRKAIRELLAWQRADSTIYSPVPAGNWDQELPMQMLASVGHYGVWTYFRNTGDTALVEEVYPAIKRYLGVWEQLPNGLVKPRKGGWTWGDWGENKDLPVLYNTWYYLALTGLRDMAELTGDEATRAATQTKMDRLKAAFHPNFWRGEAYRSNDYPGKTDERGHALAVVSGLAPVSVYPQILEVFKTQYHASPYMEKYVLEALARMGEEEFAIARMKDRFGKMIDSEYTTLFEGWGIGKEGYGGGTYNHAWSGGGLTVMSQFLAGAEPTAAGWQTYRLRPAGWPTLGNAAAEFDTPRGHLSVSWTYSATEGLQLEHRPDFTSEYVEILLPKGMEARGSDLAGRRIAFERVGEYEGKAVWRTAASAFRLTAR